MSTALNNYTRSKAPGTVEISDDEIHRFAPSVFASQPIESVSEKYSSLPTSSILNGMRANGWVPVRALEQQIRTEARRGFQKHVVRFARSEHLQTWEKNQVRPEVVLVNSHDKSSAYQLHCGLFRLVCTNGMVVSDGTFQRISIKHSGFNPDSVIEASFTVLNAVPDVMNKVQLFQDRILTDAAIRYPCYPRAIRTWISQSISSGTPGFVVARPLLAGRGLHFGPSWQASRKAPLSMRF
jgi:hypothetical protein